MLISPKDRAFWFIFSTNLSTVSALNSARVIAASFAELIISPYRRFSTVIFSPVLKNICDPSSPFAFADTVTTELRSFSSRIMIAVINFVIDAICRRSWADFS